VYIRLRHNSASDVTSCWKFCTIRNCTRYSWSKMRWGWKFPTEKVPSSELFLFWFQFTPFFLLLFLSLFSIYFYLISVYGFSSFLFLLHLLFSLHLFLSFHDLLFIPVFTLANFTISLIYRFISFPLFFFVVLLINFSWFLFPRAFFLISFLPHPLKISALTSMLLWNQYSVKQSDLWYEIFPTY